MLIRIIFVFIIILSICPVHIASAGSSSPEQPDSGKPLVLSSTAEDLLLFWEEKDIYVETATRHFKPISQTAENITVVTAKEIEDMNVHHLADVLNRVPGIFVDYGPEDFGSFAMFHIQGSETRHVLLLLDGVEWNYPDEGTAETSDIPIGIIDRIEIIKGPASSAWGSSLGGIVNIITKKTGDGAVPSGSVSASYGERNSQDYNAELSGKAGRVGYYLFAGRQESDGLRNSRWFERDGFYTKFSIPASKDISITFTAAYSEPEIFSGQLQIPSLDFTQSATTKIRTFFATASLEAGLTEELDLKLSLRSLKRKFIQPTLKTVGLDGDVLTQEIKFTSKDKSDSGSVSLVWTHGMHTAVLGVEAGDTDSDISLQIDTAFGGETTSALSEDSPGLTKWAVYVNDTIKLDRLTVTPGVRYDHNNITGGFASPSLGMTYQAGEKTILRASLARGFTVPPLGNTSVGGANFEPNPELKPESVWSYQAGLETDISDYLWLKAVIFRHEMRDGIVDATAADGIKATKKNEDKIHRTGIEIEAETAPFYNTSVQTGFAYVDLDPVPDKVTNGNYNYNVAVKYDDRKSLMAQLSGRYVWWYFGHDLMTAKYDDFICDFSLRKNIYTTNKINTELIFAAHNLFNGSYYTLDVYKNPRRWVEAGVRVKF